MKNITSPPEDAADLRRRAEDIAREKALQLQKDLEAQSPDEIRRAFHELQVHQIELEMQNEELRCTQAELETVRARYFDLYDLAPVGYCTLSLHGIIQEANLTAANLFGLARSLLVKQPLSQFILKEDQVEYYLQRKHLFETGTPQICELRMIKNDGTVFWGHMESVVVPQTEEGPTCRVVLSDISERKRAEAEKLALQAELHQSQKMESVGRLAGGVAHDFNNMLQAILLNVNLAMNEIPQTSSLSESLLEIQKCAEHSANLTRQLLAFARRQIIAPKVLDLNETVEGMLKMLQSLIGEDIDVAWLPMASLGLIKMDATQINQILANLCLNARDSIGGVGKVTIETRNESFDLAFCDKHPSFTPGDYVLLAICDTGCGMDKETLIHIFEPFFTTKEIGKGTGLGLATVYGIVKQNQGFIVVDSETGKGTHFKIYLPRFISQTTASQPETQDTIPRSLGETLLLVEDEPVILASVCKVLESLGYNVLCANKPADTIRLAASHPGEIHLLMTDVVMPEINGWDLAQQLLTTHPKLKCLFMSGYTADVITNHGILATGLNFIQKPFSFEELASKVRETLLK